VATPDPLMASKDPQASCLRNLRLEAMALSSLIVVFLNGCLFMFDLSNIVGAILRHFAPLSLKVILSAFNFFL
jgi:hypothetical protein